jgi:hypothetical protein
MKKNNFENGFLNGLISKLFKRDEDADNLLAYPNWRIGLSTAASWSWGVSLAVGMAIMHTKGLLPFIIWTIGNVLALPLFGVVRRFLPLSKYWPRFIFPIVILFFFVEFFCIILNLQGLLSGFGGNVKGIESYSFLTGNNVTIVVIAMALFIVWYIHKGGLKISVLTDFAQYGIQLFAVILMAAIGYFLGHQNNVEWIVVNEAVNGLEWAKFGFFGIITGALGTGHQWQRFSAIKEKNILPVSLWGGFLFGIYMFFVGLSGYFFTPHIVLGTFFLITMIALASSSIDSGVAGLEYVLNCLTFERWKKSDLKIKPYHVASVVACIAILAWPYFMKSGITEIWTFMAKIRMPTVLVFIGGTILVTILKYLQKLTIKPIAQKK